MAATRTALQPRQSHPIRVSARRTITPHVALPHCSLLSTGDLRRDHETVSDLVLMLGDYGAIAAAGNATRIGGLGRPNHPTGLFSQRPRPKSQR